MNLFHRFLICAPVVLAVGSVSAEVMDRPVGIRIGQRMTLKPYLSLSASYDSNISGGSDGGEDVVWVANPGLTLDYRSESWTAIMNLWYQYNAYCKSRSASQYDYHSYGEDVTVRWTDSLPGESGWALMLSEKFQFVNQLDNMTDSIGHEYGQDRQEFKFAGAVQRRFNDRLHADINANYYWLDYDNDNNQGTSYGLYGWQRWGVGAEVGYAFSKWTDLILAGSYQSYQQENRKNNWYESRHTEYGLSDNASGWTAQIGVGSYATERITYRFLGGWSSYEYDEGGKRSDGFSYTLSANWVITENWKSMILATSYYQPSEREFGSSQRVDSLSWGVTHSMVQGKLHGAFDLAYRREGQEYAAVDSYDYDLDIVTARLNLTYILNRYLQMFTTFEYRRSINENSSSSRGNYYDYDRFRGTIGVRFTY